MEPHNPRAMNMNYFFNIRIQVKRREVRTLSDSMSTIQSKSLVSPLAIRRWAPKMIADRI